MPVSVSVPRTPTNKPRASDPTTATLLPHYFPRHETRHAPGDKNARSKWKLPLPFPNIPRLRPAQHGIFYGVAPGYLSHRLRFRHFCSEKLKVHRGREVCSIQQYMNKTVASTEREKKKLTTGTPFRRQRASHVTTKPLASSIL